ncbi:hypothetical protein N7G274_009579 [Stereocaulon virgatum]|uniref:Uncharacterized protein n=1 Tax=Stereocaulon virgatum TaxID=373712 RepID=A0ABR3ZVK4_9LECA
MRRYLRDVEKYPENPDHLDLRNGHAAWLAQAERLWLDTCEELVRILDETDLASDWLLTVEPLVKVVINFVTVGSFVKDLRRIDDSQHTRDVWWLRPLAVHVRVPLVKLISHIDAHPARLTVWKGEHDALFPTPTEADYLRVAGYHRQIRESHARLSYRTHAHLEPAEV